jgi:hypothetical protein
MTIAIRLVRDVLLLLAVGAAVTAFLLGVGVADQADSCVPESGNVTSTTNEWCGVHQLEASAAFAIGAAGVAAALIALVLHAMAQPKAQVQAPRY